LVDLAKIRKKKAEGRRQKAEVPAPPPDSVAAGSQPAGPAESRPLHDSAKLERFMAEAGKKREGFVQAAAEATAGNEIEVLTFALEIGRAHV